MKLLVVGEGSSELDGALQTIVARLAERSDLEIDQAKVSQTDIHVHHGPGNGYFKRAVRWLLEGEKRGYTAIVLVIDEDGHPERVTQFAAAQNYMNATIKRALGVAIRTFDAWMLADEKAWSAVFTQVIDRQKDPESIRHPKDVFRQLHARLNEAPSVTECYAKIAGEMDLSVVESRCPKGFAPFAQRIRSL